MFGSLYSCYNNGCCCLCNFLLIKKSVNFVIVCPRNLCHRGIFYISVIRGSRIKKHRAKKVPLLVLISEYNYLDLCKINQFRAFSVSKCSRISRMKNYFENLEICYGKALARNKTSYKVFAGVQSLLRHQIGTCKITHLSILYLLQLFCKQYDCVTW